MEDNNLSKDIKPKRGDVVTFSYSGFSRSSIPIQPKIFRIREDITWEDVLFNYANDVAQAQYLNGNFIIEYINFYLLFFLCFSIYIIIN